MTTNNHLLIWKDVFSRFGLSNIKLKTPFLEAQISFQETDKEAAWELYVELLTRIATQKLPDDDGDEEAALESIHLLFRITREILKEKGRKCVQFTKLSIIVLNQIVRPFTAKWHKKKIKNEFSLPEIRGQFRDELKALQSQLCIYSSLLADIAGVEDLTSIDEMS